MVENDQSILVHLHIPKTGGTTFRHEIVPRWFAEEEILFLRKAHVATGWETRERLADPAVAARIRIISGHDVYGLGDFTGRRSETFAFVRHPVERQISQWFYHMNRSAGVRPEWRFLFDQFQTVENFIASTDVMFEYWLSYCSGEEQEFFERQARRIIAESGIEIPASFKFREIGYTLLRKGAPGVYELMRSRALTRIADSVLLLTELYDEGIALLHCLHGCPLVPYQRKLVGKKPVLPKKWWSGLEIVEEAEAYYRHWSAQFHERVAGQPNFNRSLCQLLALNRRGAEVHGGFWHRTLAQARRFR